MLKKIILTAITVLLLTGGAIYTANAINLGRAIVDNTLPETVSDNSFDAKNPGINFGLCAGFSDVPDKECFLTPEEIQNIIEYTPTEEELSQEPIRELEATPSPQINPPQTITIVKTVYMDADGNESDTLTKDEQSTQEPIPKEPPAAGEVLGASNTREQPALSADEIKALIASEVAAAQPQKGIDWGILAILIIAVAALYFHLQSNFKKQKKSRVNLKIKEKVENFKLKVLNLINSVRGKKK